MCCFYHFFGTFSLKLHVKIFKSNKKDLFGTFLGASTARLVVSGFLIADSDDMQIPALIN